MEGVNSTMANIVNVLLHKIFHNSVEYTQIFQDKIFNVYEILQPMWSYQVFLGPDEVHIH